jgi:hypothetical protein
MTFLRRLVGQVGPLGLRTFGAWSTALLAIGLLGPASSASAVTFGANLATRVANSTYTCSHPPYYPVYSPYGFMNPPWAPSCTWFSSGSLDQGVTEGDIVPFPDPAANGDQYGIITEVRIKTPSYAEPGQPNAKLTVLRSHRAIDSGEAACCIGAAETAAFTLRPNAIVNVATNLPVESIYDPVQKIYTFDSLALSILDSTTPIPAEFSADPSGYCSGGFGGAAFPGSPPGGYVKTGQERFESQYSVCGYLILMNADLTIAGAPGTGVSMNAVAPVVIGRPFVVGQARNPPTAKTQQLLILPKGGPAIEATTANSNVVVARGSTTVAPGKTVKLSVKLTPGGKKLLRKNHHLRVTLMVVATGLSGQTQTVKRTVTLRLKNH